MSQDIFNIKTLGEAMRPESLRGETFRFSREERDYIAGHALDSISKEAHDLWSCTTPTVRAGERIASDCARMIAALSNLLGDIGWEREEGVKFSKGSERQWTLGELFPVAQLRPWLEEWQHQDNEALDEAEGKLRSAEITAESGDHDDGYIPKEKERRQAIADAQTKLGTGAILLARIEKWMASHGS